MMGGPAKDSKLLTITVVGQVSGANVSTAFCSGFSFFCDETLERRRVVWQGNAESYRENSYLCELDAAKNRSILVGTAGCIHKVPRRIGRSSAIMQIVVRTP